MKYPKIISLFVAASVIVLMCTTAAATTFLPLEGFEIGIEGGRGYLGTPEHNLFDNPDIYDEYSYFTSSYTFNENHELGAFVWGLHAGYNFKVTSNAMLGLEVGYKNLGNSNYTSEIQYAYQSKYKVTVGSSGSGVYDSEHNSLSGFIHRDINQQTFDLLLTGRYFLWQNLNILSKVGVACVGSETKQNAIVTTLDHDYFYDNIDSTYTWNDYTSTRTDNYDHTIWRFRPEIALGVSYIFNQHLDLHLVWNHIFGLDSTMDTSDTSNYYYFYDEAGIPRYPSAYIYSSNSVVLGVSWVF